jgi:hypothetical protein
VLVLAMIELLPSLGLNKYDRWRIHPVKCYIDNSVRLWSYIRKINKHFWCRCRGGSHYSLSVYRLHKIVLASIISLTEFDVDINTSDTSTPTHNQISDMITWAPARQLNNQVSSFLASFSSLMWTSTPAIHPHLHISRFLV